MAHRNTFDSHSPDNHKDDHLGDEKSAHFHDEHDSHAHGHKLKVVKGSRIEFLTYSHNPKHGKPYHHHHFKADDGEFISAFHDGIEHKDEPLSNPLAYFYNDKSHTYSYPWRGVKPLEVHEQGNQSISPSAPPHSPSSSDDDEPGTHHHHASRTSSHGSTLFGESKAAAAHKAALKQKLIEDAVQDNEAECCCVIM